MMEQGFYADTLQLLQHSVELQEQKRMAAQLYEQLLMARRIADPAEFSCYDPLIQKTQELVYYFASMSDTIEKISTELEQLSVKIGAMFEDHAYWNKYYRE